MRWRRRRGKPRRNLITFVKDRPGHDRRYAMDASKIERELGWRPKETFETGIRKTVRWYLENEEWVRGRYQRQLPAVDCNALLGLNHSVNRRFEPQAHGRTGSMKQPSKNTITRELFWRADRERALSRYACHGEEPVAGLQQAHDLLPAVYA